MKCELCQSESADRRLCRVCAEAIQRLLHITSEQQRTRPTAEPGASRGAAATAGH